MSRDEEDINCIREIYIMVAMHGILSSGTNHLTAQGIADNAVDVADKTLAASKKAQPT